MKITFTLLFLVSSQILLAQEYSPMLENERVWNMKIVEWDPVIPDSETTTFYDNFFDGEIVVAGVTYTVLKDSRNDDEYNLREDVAAKMVYKYDTYLEEEVVLYDFNAELGDEFNSTLLGITTGEDRTVHEVGYATFFGETRKYWKIGFTGVDEYCATIVEGIGFITGGIINYHFVCTTVDPYYSYTLVNIDDVYLPMLVVGRVWNMMTSVWSAAPPPDDWTYHYYDYYLDGSIEIILGNEYFVLKRDTGAAVDYKYLRENIDTKTVYIYNSISETDDVLFDFNVGIGDSFNYTVDSSTCADENIVFETGVDFLFGDLRKYYKFIAGDAIDTEITVMEGVGFVNNSEDGTSGLFLSQCPSTIDGSWNYLLGMGTLGVNNYDISNKINLFFNSKNNSLQLANTTDSFELSLFSSLGKKVMQSKIDESIDASFLKKGVYFYQLQSESSISKGKLIIY